MRRSWEEMNVTRTLTERFDRRFFDPRRNIVLKVRYGKNTAENDATWLFKVLKKCLLN